MKIRCEMFVKHSLVFHTLSGCDQTGKFSRYSKMLCWDVFVTVPNEVFQTLTDLGSSDMLSSDTPSTKCSSSTLHCSSVEIMDGKEIVPTHCTKLLSPQSLQLGKQYISPFVIIRAVVFLSDVNAVKVV